MIRSLGAGCCCWRVAAAAARRRPPRRATPTPGHAGRRRPRLGGDRLASGPRRSTRFATASGAMRSSSSSALLLEFPPGDPRHPQAHFFLGEAQFAIGSQLAGGAGVPQGVATTRRTIRSRPRRCCAPATCTPTSGAARARSVLRPDRARDLPGAAQPLSRRAAGQAGAARINELQERFAFKEYRAALYYLRLKAYDSAILYLKDLVATYPRASVAPDALVQAGAGLPDAGLQGRRPGDLRLHPALPPERARAPGRLPARPAHLSRRHCLGPVR